MEMAIGDATVHHFQPNAAFAPALPANPYQLNGMAVHFGPLPPPPPPPLFYCPPSAQGSTSPFSQALFSAGAAPPPPPLPLIFRHQAPLQVGDASSEPEVVASQPPMGTSASLTPPPNSPSKTHPGGSKETGQEIEFDLIRKDFHNKLREAFKSDKPHSRSKILGISHAAVRKSYLYKVVEKALARQMDKTIIKRDCKQLRACVYLVDAIVSLARKRFGPKKERFSARLLAPTLGFLERAMSMTPAPEMLLLSVDNSQAAEEAAKKEKKKTSEFHKAKRECLRMVWCWMDKQYFATSPSSATELQSFYGKWSVHYPELQALQSTLVKRQGKSPSKSGKAGKNKSPRLPSSSSSSKARKKTNTSKELPFPVKMSSPLPPEVLPLDEEEGGPMSELEAKVQALARAGRLPFFSQSQLPLLPPPPAALPVSAALLRTPPMPNSTAQPQQWRPAVVPSQTSQQLKSSPSNTTALPRSLGQGSQVGAQLAALCAVAQKVMSQEQVLKRTPTPPPPLLPRLDPFLFLEKWQGFTPRPRPNHFTVVTSLLSLSNLPRSEDSKEQEETIRRLFGHYGAVRHISLKQRSAIIKMETRSQALKAKRAIVDQQTYSRHNTLQHAAAESQLLTLIRNKKVQLEWHPTNWMKLKCLPYWENIPHGAAFVPYTVCNVDTLTHFRCLSTFDQEKFKEFAANIAKEKDAIIVPNSLPTEQASRDSYQALTEAIFKSTLSPGYGRTNSR
ncbi:hypothetical protein RvY_18980 [Ramazzottius varieornatus]|uniref:RRM domain-containing protein n=1 Tax=Ramazzottius varieornatus TaxID=947166 RepID=A0A1D1WBD5_RAMVA|nr:hypothetical protein RvY_18980 [Ramazzottius varieornatus]